MLCCHRIYAEIKLLRTDQVIYWGVGVTIAPEIHHQLLCVYYISLNILDMSLHPVFSVRVHKDKPLRCGKAKVLRFALWQCSYPQLSASRHYKVFSL